MSPVLAPTATIPPRRQEVPGRRSRRAHRLPGFACVLVALALTQGWTSPGAHAQSLWEAPAPDEGMTREVIRKNIFLADRSGLAAAAEAADAPAAAPEESREAAAEVAAPPPPPPPDPDATRVLVGVVLVDGQPTAFIEDRSANRIDRVTGPGSYGAGEVTEIRLDGISYRSGEGEDRVVRLRQTLSGENAASLASGGNAASASTTTTTATTTAGAAAGGSPGAGFTPQNLSALERLRLRRLQESASPVSAPAPANPAP